MNISTFIFSAILISVFIFRSEAQAYDGWGDTKSFIGVSLHAAAKPGLYYSRMFGLTDILSTGGTLGIVLDENLADNFDTYVDPSFIIRVNGTNFLNTPAVNPHVSLGISVFRLTALTGVTYMMGEKIGLDLLVGLPFLYKPFHKQEDKNNKLPVGFNKPYAGLSVVINSL